MKTPDEIVGILRKRLGDRWHLDIADEGSGWPLEIPIGSPTQAELEADFAAYQQLAFEWQDWSAAHGVPLVHRSRRVLGTIQSIPTHLQVPDLDAAVALAGGDWNARVNRGRERLRLLRNRFPGVESLPAVVRGVDRYSDTDFELLCSAARWFRTNEAGGLTPRQVPVEGLHAKWLNTSRPFVQALAGLDSLGLLERHPARIHFTYLDPQHLASGSRRHDSATVGDAMLPEYLPDTILIAENKDSAIHFPSMPNAIAIEGGGFAGAEAIASFDWVAIAPRILYWGDMDAAGLAIVNQFRSVGLPITTIFMDMRSFTAYERFGTTTDARGADLTAVPRQNLPLLTAPERELYLALTDPEWGRVRRIEQERIPLAVAAEVVLAMRPRRLEGAAG